MRFSQLFFTFFAFVITSCNTAQTVKKGDGLFAKIETAKGTILLELEFEKTPITVANFVSLAEGDNTYVDAKFKGKPFYDGLTFHRVIKDFMAQGGDPNGNGSGNPGYKFGDEFPKNEEGELLLKHDTIGILSMANTGVAANGSQFFITYKPKPHLDGKHTVFGHVVEGQNVVSAIEKGDKIQKIVIVRKGKKAHKFKASKVFAKGKEQMLQAEVAKKERIQKAAKTRTLKFAPLKEKAISLDSGLQIYIEKPSEGIKPKQGQFIKVSYAGFLTDGTMFSTNRKEIAKEYERYDERRDMTNGYSPFKTVCNNEAKLIHGFKEGLQQLKVGDKAVLFIPSELGYGKQGVRGTIPPNSDLIFEVEITEIITKK